MHLKVEENSCKSGVLLFVSQSRWRRLKTDSFNHVTAAWPSEITTLTDHLKWVTCLHTSLLHVILMAEKMLEGTKTTVALVGSWLNANTLPDSVLKVGASVSHVARKLIPIAAFTSACKNMFEARDHYFLCDISRVSGGIRNAQRFPLRKEGSHKIFFKRKADKKKH